MDLSEFREIYINEDINAVAKNDTKYPVDVFLESASEILRDDYSLLTDMNSCYYAFTEGTKAYKNMHIDGAYLDQITNTLNLMYVDFNPGEIINITNEFINNKSNLLINFFINTLKGFFAEAEPSAPHVQLARDINYYEDLIHKVHLFIVSTNKLSKVVKTLNLDDIVFNGRHFKVDLDVLDIEAIYRSKLPNFQKEDIIINCNDFGIDGIPCIKADIETDQYESYLAIVPGKFLAEIYKKYSAALLESNVRSFLKFNGSINKGIRNTIKNEKSRFFTYNNGISTTAKEVETMVHPQKGLLITSLKDLQIINGGQTTATLAATNIKDDEDLSGIFVQMKLTILKDSDPELIRNIAKYANSQNKVKTADLNSSHPFYVRMEEFSRKNYAPLQSGQIIQTLWFFERARGQYEQPMMQMTKKECQDYKTIRPKNQKFTLVDLAKYVNAASMLPHFVSWGGEVNAAHFHNNMVKLWDADKNKFNELYYKELVAKKIMFSFIEKIISDQEWYQERRAYRPQLVAYTFSKLVYEVQNMNLMINYKRIWEKQEVSNQFAKTIARIGKLVFDVIYDDARSTANIESYCKKQECWDIVRKKEFNIPEELADVLITITEKKVDDARARKDQKLNSGIENELSIYQKGSKYWTNLMGRAKAQELLNLSEIDTLKVAINYCNMVYTSLSKRQVQEIVRIENDLKNYFPDI